MLIFKILAKYFLIMLVWQLHWKVMVGQYLTSEKVKIRT